MHRRTQRLERRLKKEEGKSIEVNAIDVDQLGRGDKNSDDKFAKLLTQNEDDLLNFVAKINKVYQETLRRPAAPLNIVQEGTGTRCPLDTTCIHDSSLSEPRCELSGEELDPSWAGTDLTTEEVFAAITEHNKELGSQDKFSTQPLTLVYRASNVQNMRFVDTPGIIANQVSKLPNTFEL